jgi:sulfur carrier protein
MIINITIVNKYICDKMEFELKYKQINETRQLRENYTIKDLLDDLGLSTQTTVAKQNGDLTIEESTINDGDEIQLVQIIYGG